MAVPSYLDIARSVRPRPVADIAHELGFRDDEIELYGSAKAKVTIEGIRRVEAERQSQLMPTDQEADEARVSAPEGPWAV